MQERFSHICGHKQQISGLLGLLERGAIPQGLVFAGAEHLGKATIAHACVAALLNVPLHDLSRHPDVLLLVPSIRESGKKAYDLDDIREALRRLGQSPIYGRAVLVIDDANVLSVAAQNALLKTLEEPNGNTVIVFIVHELSSMLPTVLSRTVTIPFSLVADEALHTAALKNSVPEESIEHALIAAAGRPGIFFSFLSHTDHSDLDERLADVKSLLSSSVVDRLKGAQALGKREALDLDELLVCLLRMMKNTKKYSSKTLNAVLKTRERIAANGNSTIALEQLALQLGVYE